MSVLAVNVEGVGLWSPRLPSWSVAQAVIRGEAAAPDAAPRPQPALLAPAERRRAPDTVALALAVAVAACEAAQRAPASLPAVFASTHGDLAITDYLCATLATTPAMLSPTKFHNSVHNAAAGYWSIGTGSHACYTAVSAAAATFGSGLIEAAVHAIADDTPVLYVAYDVEARGPLATVAPSSGSLGVAFVLAPARTGSSAPRLELTVGQLDRVVPTPARTAAAALISGNAMAPCLPLLELLARGTPGDVTLALGRRAALIATLLL